ncbi:MAG: hypothetical protein ACQCN6_03805 [Candidatus Bathyarchaeia archaeon]
MLNRGWRARDRLLIALPLAKPVQNSNVEVRKSSARRVLLDLTLSKINAVDWLTDDRWIVFGYNGGLGQYLEHCYFAPGTPKSAEFEVMVAPVVVDGISGISAFFRIKDTVENRDSLRAALSEFHDKRLLSLAELDDGIEALRQRIKEKVVPKLR